MTNRLKIDADRLKLEFSGEADDIRRGYELTRELLIHHFQEQLVRVEEEQRGKEVKKPEGTQMLHVVKQAGKSWSPPRKYEAMHVSIALCSDFYNKVCVLDRDEYEKSFLEDLFTFERIGRIFIRHEQSDHFKKHFTIGKVLWRELTTDGRAAVRSEGR